MNYQEHIQKFWKLNKNNPIGLSSISVYLFLLDNWFKNDTSNFTISDMCISKQIGITSRSINSIKGKLQKLGLINFLAKNGAATHYTILELKEFQSLEIQEPIKIVEKKKSITSSKKRIEAIDPLEIPATPIQITNSNIPSLKEFSDYAKSLAKYELSMEELLNIMYQNMVQKGWKNSYDRPIINWKSLLEKQLPFLNTNTIKRSTLQTINRPKNTNNE
jgi:hypothetical protein